MTEQGVLRGPSRQQQSPWQRKEGKHNTCWICLKSNERKMEEMRRSRGKKQARPTRGSSRAQFNRYQAETDTDTAAEWLTALGWSSFGEYPFQFLIVFLTKRSPPLLLPLLSSCCLMQRQKFPSPTTRVFPEQVQYTHLILTVRNSVRTSREVGHNPGAELTDKTRKSNILRKKILLCL